jgi:transcriptional regulator with XRE-family HTH domain
MEMPHVLISKSMEKTFLRLRNKRSRTAYVEAELVNGISAQIRVLRQQRGWTQKEFAEKLGTSQAVVSRLEDPSYGRYSLKTLLDIGSLFDVALFARFMPFSQAVPATWNTRRENLEAESFEKEIDRVHFYSTNANRYLAQHEVSSASVGVFKSFIRNQLEGYDAATPPTDWKKYARVKCATRSEKMAIKIGA